MAIEAKGRGDADPGEDEGPAFHEAMDVFAVPDSIEAHTLKRKKTMSPSFIT